MIIILGLIILVAAIVVGVAGVLGNGGTHGLAHGFSVLGYHVTGSGTVFLYGIAVGAVALFGLWLLLAGVRRTSRRGRAARRGLRQSQRETAQSRQETAAVSKDRDDLIGQRDTARAYTASTLANGEPPGNGTPPSNDAPPASLDPSQNDSHRGRPRLFGRRPAGPQAGAAGPEPAAGPEAPGGQPAADIPSGEMTADVPADAPAPAR
jgi:hypothetical protein